MRHANHLVVVLFLAATACGPAGRATRTDDHDLESATAGGPPAGAASGASDAPIEIPPFPEDAFRAEIPKAGPDRPFKLPAVQRFKIGPAIDVYLMEDHDLPVVSLDVNLDGGAINEPPGKIGLASVCMNMLTEGTARLDKIAYSEALADIASNVSAYSGKDRQGVAMSTLKRNLPATFALFAETITTPGFRQADFDRMIKRGLESLKQAKASPASINGRVAGTVLYGAAHPLGRIFTEQTLGAITLADCKKYHADYVKPRGARLFVTGDITRPDLEAAIAPLLASWKGAPRKTAAVPRPKPPTGKIFFVHVPNAAQSNVSLIHLGPKRTSPTYFANQLMAQLLGGGFASRINMNLREDKGYSYGARGGFDYNRFHGAFTAASSVRTDATAQSVIELYGEVQGIKDASRPPTDLELSREKNAAILGLPSQFATGSDTIGMVRGLVYFGLPLDYYNKYVDAVNKVSLEAVAAAARRELKPSQAHILVVGDGDAPQIAHDPNAKGAAPPMAGKDGKPMTLRQALAAMAADGRFGKGALVELDADGKVVSK